MPKNVFMNDKTYPATGEVASPIIMTGKARIAHGDWQEDLMLQERQEVLVYSVALTSSVSLSETDPQFFRMSLAGCVVTRKRKSLFESSPLSRYLRCRKSLQVLTLNKSIPTKDNSFPKWGCAACGCKYLVDYAKDELPVLPAAAAGGSTYHTWSSEELVAYLSGKLPQYSDEIVKLAEHEVSGEDLATLTIADINKCGIAKVGIQKKLMRVIKNLL